MGGGANHFAVLNGDNPGDTRLVDLNSKKQAAPGSLTEELFGRAYPSAWKTIKNMQKQEHGATASLNRKKGAQGKGTKQGGRHGNGAAAAANDEAPAPRLYDLAQFPSLK